MTSIIKWTTIFTLLFSALTFATPENNSPIILRDNQGNSIKITANFFTPRMDGCYKCALPTFAQPLTIQVTPINYYQIEYVHVVLLNFEQGSPHYGRQKDIHMDEYRMDLQYDRLLGVYIGSLDKMITITRGYRGTHKYRQEIAVVLKRYGENEFWFHDPISKTNNFKFNLIP